ncbi:hypothetical protein CERSUDRAFT_94746 [Gelatoporia subvermispora B]|uniref:Uncharacterized protein n=1 Tax=Ceriporiopsis subvermispora (strain B) TaxID=914234 RepID=M2PMV5_CERS8|nr:hypothetical protein CERSUDRAFT_94746 [Gelatoporia subvermispora B]
MALDLIRAQILALFFLSIFLGIHLIVFTMALWAQIWANPARGKKTNWILVAISLVMGAIGIFNAALDVHGNIWAFTTENPEVFLDASSWGYVAGKVDEIVPAIIGDTVLTYRCWIVYERRWKAVIISIILWISAVTFAVFVVVKSALVQYVNGINNPALTPFIAAALGCSVLLNVLTTSLIVYRIWMVTRHIRSQFQAVGQTRLTYVNRIIIESGLIYTISAIIFLFTALIQSNAIYITGECFVQLTGIAFNLIIIRFDQNLAGKQSNERDLTWCMATAPSSGLSSDGTTHETSVLSGPSTITPKNEP